jgi:glycosyltransferase involved in cell wall biosynthesis
MLEQNNIETEVSFLFSNRYIESLQDGRRDFFDIALGYARRIRSLFYQKNFDLLWIEKECFPWLPSWFEKALLSGNIPIVFDFDDAVFHYYDTHRSSLVRNLLAKKHAKIIRDSALVIVGNQYLANFAETAGASNIEVLPTVIDLERYTNPESKASPNASDLMKVVWIGQQSTAKFLYKLAPLFRSLISEGQIGFGAIGIDTASHKLPMESIPWSEDTEVESILGFDVGIMPLEDGPFERGKCGYKLIQYMACGLPVVASPVGVNRQIVQHGVNGFLAKTVEDWRCALTRLREDPELRLRMGAEGRRLVERRYCVQVTAPRLATLFRDIVYAQNSTQINKD